MNPSEQDWQDLPIPEMPEHLKNILLGIATIVIPVAVLPLLAVVAGLWMHPFSLMYVILGLPPFITSGIIFLTSRGEVVVITNLEWVTLKTAKWGSITHSKKSIAIITSVAIGTYGGSYYVRHISPETSVTLLIVCAIVLFGSMITIHHRMTVRQARKVALSLGLISPHRTSLSDRLTWKVKTAPTGRCEECGKSSGYLMRERDEGHRTRRHYLCFNCIIVFPPLKTREERVRDALRWWLERIRLEVSDIVSDEEPIYRRFSVLEMLEVGDKEIYHSREERVLAVQPRAQGVPVGTIFQSSFFAFPLDKTICWQFVRKISSDTWKIRIFKNHRGHLRHKSYRLVNIGDLFVARLEAGEYVVRIDRNKYTTHRLKLVLGETTRKGSLILAPPAVARKAREKKRETHNWDHIRGERAVPSKHEEPDWGSVCRLGDSFIDLTPLPLFEL